MSRLLRVARLRLQSVWRPRGLNAQLDRELAQHFEELVRESISSGMSPAAARHAAARAFGNVATIAEEARGHRGFNRWNEVRQDVTYAARSWRRDAGTACLIVMSLGLGIGASAASLLAIHAVLVRPIAAPMSERLVRIGTIAGDSGAERRNASGAEYVAWRDSGAFEQIGASWTGERDISALNDEAAAERITGTAVTSEWFSLLGIRPMRGRLFTDDEFGRDGLSTVAIISERLWRRRFQSDESVVGRHVRVNGSPVTIVGIIADTERYNDWRVNAWFPMRIRPGPGQLRLFEVTGRLGTGVSLKDAAVTLSAPAQHPHAAAVRDTVRLVPLQQALFGWATFPLSMLAAVAIVVLVIACVNAAGLLLALSSGRQREIGTRMALGASRQRIARQLLTESTLIATLSCSVAIPTAWLAVRALALVMNPPVGVPQIGVVSVSAMVTILVVCASIGLGLAIGAPHAFAGSRRSLMAFLSGATTTLGTTLRRQRTRQVFVSVQIGLAIIAMTVAAFLVTSFLRVAGRNLNIDLRDVIALQYRTSGPGASERVGRVFDALRSTPGLTSVVGISTTPVNSIASPLVDVRLPGAAQTSATASYFLVTPRFFSTMKTPVIRGREIDERDVIAATWVAVVNETAAASWWPRDNAVGKSIVLETVPKDPPRVVVGVVKDIPLQRGATVQRPIVYTPHAQQVPRDVGPLGGMFGQMVFLVRPRGDPEALGRIAQTAASKVDLARPIAMITTFNGGGPLNQRRNYAAALAILAGIALIIASMGVYGVVSDAVNRSAQELGLRKALGATTTDVIRLVASRVGVMMIVGTSIGVAGAIATTRLIAASLWGVQASDPRIYSLAVILVATAVVVACAGPVRRALRASPTVVLRDL